MMILEHTIEIAMALLGIISTLLGILVKRIHSKMDKLEHDLQNHRVEDARSYITRKEHDDKMEILKKDLREMIGSIGVSVRRIEGHLMNNKKGL